MKITLPIALPPLAPHSDMELEIENGKFWFFPSLNLHLVLAQSLTRLMLINAAFKL